MGSTPTTPPSSTIVVCPVHSSTDARPGIEDDNEHPADPRRYLVAVALPFAARPSPPGGVLLLRGPRLLPQRGPPLRQRHPLGRGLVSLPLGSRSRDVLHVRRRQRQPAGGRRDRPPAGRLLGRAPGGRPRPLLPRVHRALPSGKNPGRRTHRRLLLPHRPLKGPRAGGGPQLAAGRPPLAREGAGAHRHPCRPPRRPPPAPDPPLPESAAA